MSEGDQQGEEEAAWAEEGPLEDLASFATLGHLTAGIEQEKATIRYQWKSRTKFKTRQEKLTTLFRRPKVRLHSKT